MNKDGSLNQPDFLRKLPLLEFTVSLFEKTDLSKYYLICAQHLASTTYSLFYTLLELGLPPDQISIIGKCYSTDPQSYEELSKLGIDVCPSSLSFDSHSPYDEQYHQNVWDFVIKRRSKLDLAKKIIVLDDGGDLISCIVSFFKNEKTIVGIEQTSSGFHKLNKKEIPFPIINVARSAAKLNFESPIISRLVLETLSRLILSLSLRPENILIIGNGSIGKQIDEVFKKNYQTSIYDIDPSKSKIHINEFCKSLKKFDLIIGCTGTTVLTSQHDSYLKKGVLLVSASSSDREFDAVHLRRQVPQTTNCHQNLVIGDIHLLNCGFPINFAAEYRAIDSDDLQLTRSLLLAAVLQAPQELENRKTGFIPLNTLFQQIIVQKYLSLFGSQNHSYGDLYDNCLL